MSAKTIGPEEFARFAIRVLTCLAREEPEYANTVQDEWHTALEASEEGRRMIAFVSKAIEEHYTAAGPAVMARESTIRGITLGIMLGLTISEVRKDLENGTLIIDENGNIQDVAPDPELISSGVTGEA